MLHNKRAFRDSGVRTLINDVAITSNGIFVFILDEKWKPYDQSAMVNNSGSDVGVAFDCQMDFIELVPKSNQIIFTGKKIDDIRIKNIGATTIEIGEIVLALRNTGFKGVEIETTAKDLLRIASNIAIVLK